MILEKYDDSLTDQQKKKMKDLQAVFTYKQSLLFNWMTGVMDTDGSSLVKKFGAEHKLRVTDSKDGLSWNCDIDFKNGPGQIFISEGAFDTTDERYVTFISISESNLYRVLNKEMSPHRIFFTGQVKAYGGIKALWAAKKFFEKFLLPYLIENWNEEEAERKMQAYLGQY